jgi:hypothetical protein
MYPYMLTEKALTVFTPGEILTLDSSHFHFDRAIEALKFEDMGDVVRLMQPAVSIIEETANFPEFAVKNGCAYYKGEELKGYAIDRLMDMIVLGLPIEPIVNFIRRVSDNPSSRAVNDLYRFLEFGQLPLMPDGRFLAYKRIRSDWKDVHSGTFYNYVGAVISMPRNQVDDDPTRTCSHGLHVCSMEYLKHFSGERIVAVAVDPKDVVAIPKDYNDTKMRVCSYTVMDEIPMPEEYNHWNRPVVDEYDDEDYYYQEEEDEVEFDEIGL